MRVSSFVAAFVLAVSSVCAITPPFESIHTDSTSDSVSVPSSTLSIPLSSVYNGTSTHASTTTNPGGPMNTTTSNPATTLSNNTSTTAAPTSTTGAATTTTTSKSGAAFAVKAGNGEVVAAAAAVGLAVLGAVL
ncbi:hypothetical protein DL93DRAFT_2093692 [Clavulina sp. PMI_390]|nr:hypothetical protein DL93DRAFT_2093692 [Clavulina sp. PMI_390]